MRKTLLIIVGLAAAAWAQDLSWQDRLEFYAHRTFSPARLTLLAAETGLDHLLDQPKEWGQEPHTYACRYSAAFGRRLVRNSIELGLGAALHEDTRLQPSRGGRFRSRLWYAAQQTFQARNGRFAYSRFAATVGGAFIISRWEPPSLTMPGFFERIASGYLGQLQNSLLAEFQPDLKRVGRRVRHRVAAAVGLRRR